MKLNFKLFVVIVIIMIINAKISGISEDSGTSVQI